MATTITPTIVTLNTIVTTAPQPNTLQQSGVVVSAGGSTLTTGTYQYCGSPAAVTAILAAPLAITSLAWASGTVTATVAAMTLAVGQVFTTTIAGATPAGYNGTFVATVASSTTFTYALTTDPGTETAPGTYTPPYSAFLTDAATTFFAQGAMVGLYVLELGPEATDTAAITALGTWLTSNPNVFYAALVAPHWDSVALGTLANTYTSPASKFYFFPTTTQATISNYVNMKSVIATVEAPSSPISVVTAAALFYAWVSQTVSEAAPARPVQYRQLFGCTPWPVYGQTAAVNSILTAFGNIAYSGTEGGLLGTYIWGGRTMDGAQAMFWYSVDWFQIQAKQALAAAIINASNALRPVVYNQNGINALQAVAQQVANSSISFGLSLSVVVTAVPFTTYTTDNPSNYAAGIYGGLAATVTPQLGFETITFNIDATQIA